MNWQRAVWLGIALLAITPAEARRHHHAHSHRIHIPEPYQPHIVRDNTDSRIAVARDTVELYIEPQPTAWEAQAPIRFLGIRQAFYTPVYRVISTPVYVGFTDSQWIGLGILFLGLETALIGIARLPGSTIVTGIDAIKNQLWLLRLHLLSWPTRLRLRRRARRFPWLR